MRKYQGLLLDFYGTLVHEDDEIIPLICEAIRADAGCAADVRAIAQFWWEAFSSLCSNSYGSGFLSQRDAALRSLAATAKHFGATIDSQKLIAPHFVHWAAPSIFPDTRPFLSYVTAKHLPICIVSNIDRIDLEQALGFHALHFEHIVTSDDVRSYKPRPEMFEVALGRLGFAPHEVLHVGDSRTSDVIGAQRMGIPVAWVNRSGKQCSGDREPDYIVRDLGKIQTILAAG